MDIHQPATLYSCIMLILFTKCTKVMFRIHFRRLKFVHVR
jgi:hypothetical protein